MDYCGLLHREQNGWPRDGLKSFFNRRKAVVLGHVKQPLHKAPIRPYGGHVRQYCNTLYGSVIANWPFFFGLEFLLEELFIANAISHTASRACQASLYLVPCIQQPPSYLSPMQFQSENCK
jgi:hypothetical protein